MLYLEDYLEIIEHLPQELRDRFTEIREMDLQVNNAMDDLDEQVKQFFLNAKRMKTEQRDAEFQRLKQEYMKTLEDADEKVNLANQIYELVDRYLRRLDQELHKFKHELEADNSGITEMLERRSLELDLPPPSHNHVRDKRKYSNINSHSPHLAHVRDGHPFGNNAMAARLNANLYGTGSLSPAGTVSNGSLTPLVSQLGAGLGTPSPASQLPLAYSHPLTASDPLAAAASQAIAATQQMQQGRRTASLKASIEAINTSFPSTMLGGDMSLGLSGPSGFGLLEGAAAPKRRNRIPNHFDDESSESGIGQFDSENGHATEWANSMDPNEPRYCLCNQVSYGEMDACDNPTCQGEWFHYGCVGLTQAPKGKWYCPTCAPMMAVDVVADPMAGGKGAVGRPSGVMPVKKKQKKIEKTA